MKVAFAMDPTTKALVITTAVRARLETAGVTSARDVTAIDVLNGHASDIEMLITGWGTPEITPRLLDMMPSLRAIVHWGGAVDFVDEAAWQRGVHVSSAGWANAIPVAEFTLAMITLAAKDAFRVSRQYRAEQRRIDREVELPGIGAYGARVGIIGASRIGSLVLEGLRSRDLRADLYDPTCTAERAKSLGTQLVPDLVELASGSHILTIHAPVLPGTIGMVSEAVLAALPDGATVINTARGSLVDQDALVRELQSRRLSAILDVTEPDVLPAGHPLYTLENVFLTPHLAGSAGNELERLGMAAASEVERYAAGEELAHLVAARVG